MKKAAKPLLIVSLVLSILYLAGMLIYFAFARGATTATLGAAGMSGYNAFAQYGISYVFDLLIPHFLTCAIGIVFNIIAIAKRDIPWFALIAGIMFAVSLLLAYGSFWIGVIVEAILCFIAFAGLLQKDKSSPVIQQQAPGQIVENAGHIQNPAAGQAVQNAANVQNSTPEQQDRHDASANGPVANQTEEKM